jgi:hypothetical protein
LELDELERQLPGVPIFDERTARRADVLDGPTTAAAGGDLTGSYPDPQLGAGVVGADETGHALAVRVGVSGAPEIPPSASHMGMITWTTEWFDVGGIRDPASPTLLKAPRNGLYEVTANVVIRRSSGSTGIHREVLISQDGISPSGAVSVSSLTAAGWSALTRAVAGATWRVVVAHDASDAQARCRSHRARGRRRRAALPGRTPRGS